MTKRKRPKRRPQSDRPPGPAVPRGAPPGSIRIRSTWPVLLLIAAGALVYLNSFGGTFQFDGVKWIVENRQIRSLQPIADCLTNTRRPVVNLSLAVNYAAGELDTWGYHLFNLTVHLLAGVTLFGIIRRTVPRVVTSDRGRRSATLLAVAVALIWLVHPLQTQSVTYIIQRGESLMGLFYLLTLYCVIRGFESARPRRWYAAAVLACALGMGSKAVMVIAPLMVLLYDRVFVTRSLPEILGKRWGLYAGLAATWLVLVAVGVARGVLSTTAKSATVGFSYKGATPIEYALTQPRVILHYLGLCFWPRELCLDYDWPLSSGSAEIVIPSLIVAALVAVSIWALVRVPWLGFAGLWFFGILAPTSSFIPIRDVAFEHRMYLPLVSVVLVTVVAGHKLVNYVCGRLSQRTSLRQAVSVGLVVLVAGSLGLRTVYRNKDYHSLEGMWRLVTEQRPWNARAHYNLGHELARQERFEEAVSHYEKALELRPGYLEARNNLGLALAELGRSDQAIEAYAEAIRQKPDFFEPYYNLGRELAKLGRIDEAIARYNKALELKPDYADAHNALGASLVNQGKVDEAIGHYRQAIALRPDLATAHDNLGNACLMKGQFDEAITHCTEAVRLDPDLPEAHADLGIALAQVGRVEEAIAHLNEAVRLNPGVPSVHKNLGVLLADKGRLDEAVAHLRQALALRPMDADARYTLGEALLRRGDFDAAAQEFQTVLRIDPQYPNARQMLEAAKNRQPP